MPPFACCRLFLMSNRICCRLLNICICMCIICISSRSIGNIHHSIITVFYTMCCTINHISPFQIFVVIQFVPRYSILVTRYHLLCTFFLTVSTTTTMIFNYFYLVYLTLTCVLSFLSFRFLCLIRIYLNFLYMRKFCEHPRYRFLVVDNNNNNRYSNNDCEQLVVVATEQQREHETEIKRDRNKPRQHLQ